MTVCKSQLQGRTLEPGLILTLLEWLKFNQAPTKTQQANVLSKGKNPAQPVSDSGAEKSDS